VFCVLLLAWPTRSKGELAVAARCHWSDVAGRTARTFGASIIRSRADRTGRHAPWPQALCILGACPHAFDFLPRCCGQNTLATTGRCTASACLAIALACALASEGLFIIIFGLYAVTSFGAWRLFICTRVGPELAGRVELSGGAGARLARDPLGRDCRSGGGTGFWILAIGSQWELGINTRGRQTGMTDGPWI